MLAERYHIRELIGEGGMGRVYAGEHVLMHKRVAVKVLHKELTTLSDVVHRFEREAMAAANIDHPNVAAATDFGHLPDGSVFLVLEYVQGISLRSEIASGPFDVARALHIARQIASALASAQARGIVHRDLKPENVMLVEKAGDPDFVKVLDFGIAKVPIQEISDRGSVRPGQIITKVGMVFGTPEYMAPEQALGEEADGRADQYALGVILFEMLAGRRPYQHSNQIGLLGKQLQMPTPTVAEVATNVVVPAGVDELISTMLAADRENRYCTSLEVVEAIDAVLATLQPNRSIRGRRSDAALGSAAVAEGPVSSRSRRRLESAALDRPKQHLAASEQGVDIPLDRDTGRLARLVRQRLTRPSVRVVLALLGGLAVAGLGVAIGFVLIATRSNLGFGGRHSPISGTSTVQGSSRVPGSERAAASELSLARSTGLAALDALAQKYPTDASIVLELAKVHFARGDFLASVSDISRALAIDPRIANNAETATLLWKTVQKRECGEPAFKLLEGPMAGRGADILYDLATTEGVRRDIRQHAEEFFLSGRYRTASSVALSTLIGLKYAATCDERRRYIEQASNVGDDRFLPLLEQLQSKVGCGRELLDDCDACLRTSDLLEHAIEVIRMRSGS